MMMKQRLKNRLIKHLFNTVTIGDIVTYDKGGSIYVDKQKLSQTEIDILGREARDFMESRLYKVLYGTVKDKAHKTMFQKSVTFDDMVSGKMILLSLDLQQKIINTFQHLLQKGTSDKK